MQWRYGLVVLVLLFIGTGCANDPGTLGFPNNTFSADYGIMVVDTTTVAVSTVLLDSLPTSETGSLLIGGYNDIKLGRLQAEGYAQIGLGTSWTPPATATFDSLILVAGFSRYVYGDTTAAQVIEVRRITQAFRTFNMPQFWINEGQYSILFTQNSKYNSSAMSYDPTALGSRSFRLRPNSSDSISIRLNNQLGADWLTLAKEKAPTITEASNFVEYFKGVSLASISPDPESVVGFKTESLKIRLYYKVYVNEVLTQLHHDFPFTSGYYNYSKITADRSGTVLENLVKRQTNLPTTQTGDESFVQSGTGIVTKVTFPYMTKLLMESNALLVNQAQLILEPVKDTFNDTYPLPASLTLYTTDKTNLPLARVFANYSTSSYQSASISFDKEFDTSTGYVFNLTQYMQASLSTEGNQEKGLLIMPPADEINKSVNKIHIGDGSGAYRVRLKIWYTYSK